MIWFVLTFQVTKSWKKLNVPGETPAKRYGHTAVVYNGRMYVYVRMAALNLFTYSRYGGYDDFGMRCNDLWEYSFGNLVSMRLLTHIHQKENGGHV